jgi:hypothetical protein
MNLRIILTVDVVAPSAETGAVAAWRKLRESQGEIVQVLKVGAGKTFNDEDQELEHLGDLDLADILPPEPARSGDEAATIFHLQREIEALKAAKAVERPVSDDPRYLPAARAKKRIEELETKLHCYADMIRRKTACGCIIPDCPDCAEVEAKC